MLLHHFYYFCCHPEQALTSLTACDAYRHFAGQAYLLGSLSRPRTEYLLQTDNIIVLDWYFNMTKKFNLTGGLEYYFCLHLVVTNFLGHPVYEAGNEVKIALWANICSQSDCWIDLPPTA